MAASGSNSGSDKNYRPAATNHPVQTPVAASPPTHCESCRSAPAIPFCRVEWSFLCAGCAPVVHSNSWIVAVNPNPSFPYPYPQPFPVPNPNPNNPNPTYRERKRTRKSEVRNESRSTNVESMSKGSGTESAAAAAAAADGQGQGVDGGAGSDGSKEGGSTAAVVLV